MTATEQWREQLAHEARLSPEQVAMLVWILRAYRAAEERDRLTDGRWSELTAIDFRHWGVRLPRRDYGTSRSESASWSRSLRRLEDRGLVRRRNEWSGDRWEAEDPPIPAEALREMGLRPQPPTTRAERQREWELAGRQTRTTRIQLTPEGRRLAEGLTDGPRSPVNQSDERERGA